MRKILIIALLSGIVLSACRPATPTIQPDVPLTAVVLDTPAVTEEASQPTESVGEALYKDPSQPVEARVNDLLPRMTLQEKIGQITQVEKNSIKPEDITRMFIGSVLSGGGGSPNGDNTPEGWANMVDGFQRYALRTRLGIPIIYGVDAVHGNAEMRGATIFPVEVGLGASLDPDLVTRVAQATADEMLATGISWDFAPVIAVPQDIRWGRAWEAFGEKTNLVSELGTAYIKGLQTLSKESIPGRSIYVLASPKHYIGDGGTTWGSSTQNIQNHPYMLDQGDMRVDDATIRKLFLPPYQAAVDAGAMNVMVSFSSWNGTKMHAQKFLLTDVLKNELGFKGFLVSDWGGIDQISSDYYTAVVQSFNAGMDMNMVPTDYVKFINTITKAVKNGDISEERIDDAVRRILTVKFELGLFETPYSDPTLLQSIGSDEHRQLAREAVRKSLVLLKNDKQALPLSKEAALVLVGGQGADDIGMQSGGWTVDWQGRMGNITPGTSILQGIQQAVSPQSAVQYDPTGTFPDLKNQTADIGIAVVGEKPYAEGVGDTSDLSLYPNDIKVIENMRPLVKELIVVILSGRPMVITEQLKQMDALVAAWWPGTEGEGVADVLFGDYPFTGKLPYTWPRWNSQLPFDFQNLPKDGCAAPLFPFGYGLGTKDPSPVIPDCPVQ